MAALPELSSSYINDVYDDNDFNFMVTLYPEKYPNVNRGAVQHHPIPTTL